MIKQRDKLILAHLRGGARKALTKINRQTSIPISTLFDRIRHLEQEGFIKRYVSLLAFEKLGYDLRVFIGLKVRQKDIKRLGKFLAKHSNSNSVFRTSGHYDFLIEAIFKDAKELQEFMDKLNRFQVQEAQELFILEELKRECFLSDPRGIE